MLPETLQVPGDGLFDVGDRFGTRLPLRNAAGQGRDFGNEDAFFVLFDEHAVSHGGDLLELLVTTKLGGSSRVREYSNDAREFEVQTNGRL